MTAPCTSARVEWVVDDETQQLFTVMASQPVLGPLVTGGTCAIMTNAYGRPRCYCRQPAARRVRDANGRVRDLCAECAAFYFPTHATRK